MFGVQFWSGGGWAESQWGDVVEAAALSAASSAGLLPFGSPAKTWSPAAWPRLPSQAAWPGAAWPFVRPAAVAASGTLAAGAAASRTRQ